MSGAAISGQPRLASFIASSADTSVVVNPMMDLRASAIAGSCRAMEIALAAGHSVNAVDKLGRSVLSYVLLRQNQDPEGNDDDVIRFLLEHGAEPNFSSGANHGIFPLHYVMTESKARLLLAHGARVDCRDARGTTPLMDAAHGGLLGLARLLLRRGADVAARDVDGVDAVTRARDALAACRWEARPEGDYPAVIALLAAVDAAGSWKRYATQPTAALLALRRLVLAGRARPPPRYRRLFGAAPSTCGRRSARTRSERAAASVARTTLPDDVFAVVLAFWGGNH